MTRLVHHPPVAERPAETQPETPPDVPLALELVLYLAAAAVAVGSTFVVTRFWADLAVGGRLLIGAAVAALGFGAAHRLGSIRLDAVQRMTAVLRVVGVAGVALSSGVLARWAGAEDPNLVAVAVGAPIAALGFADWRNRDRPLPYLLTVGGLVTIVAGLADRWGVSALVAGAILWAPSMVLLAAAVGGSLRPADVAAITAAIGSFAGATAFAQDLGRPGIFLVVADATLIVAVAVATRHTPLLVVGLGQLVLTLPQALGAYLHGLGAALGLLLGGLLVLGLVVRRLAARMTAGHPR